MAQKKRPTARATRPAKSSGSKAPTKRSSVKPSTKSPAKKIAAPAAAAKSKTKTPASPAPAVKPAAAKRSAPKIGAAGPPQLARAKSALKKQNATADSTSVEAAPAPAPVPKKLSARAEKARARKISIEINANEAASALAAKWSSLFKRADNIDAQPYNMKSMFEERTAIVHKVLGWGYILANRNDRLEVLFKDGIKYLISNYKP